MSEKFTPARANAALHLVRPIVADVVDHHRRLVDLVKTYQARRAEPDVPQTALNDLKREMAALTAGRDACIAELTELGILLRDANTGLIDFPGEIDGEPALLCWQFGEPRVEWWHGENEGFAGRKPIPIPVHA
jgi:hypothetical protein